MSYKKTENGAKKEQANKRLQLALIMCCSYILISTFFFIFFNTCPCYLHIAARVDRPCLCQGRCSLSAQCKQLSQENKHFPYFPHHVPSAIQFIPLFSMSLFVTSFSLMSTFCVTVLSFAPLYNPFMLHQIQTLICNVRGHSAEMDI